MTTSDAPTFGATEPVTITATVQTVALAVIGLGTQFEWWHWSDAQTGAVLTVLAVIAAAAGGYVRARVTPNAKVALTTGQADMINATRNPGGN